MNENYKLKISTPGVGKQAFSLVMSVCTVLTVWLPFYIFATDKYKEMESIAAFGFASFPFIYLACAILLYFTGRNEERSSLDKELEERDKITLAEFIEASESAKQLLNESANCNKKLTYRVIQTHKKEIESGVTKDKLAMAGLS